MTKGLLFWILFVLAILFGGFGVYHTYHGGFEAYGGWGLSVLELVLFYLLGSKVFGPALKD